MYDIRHKKAWRRPLAVLSELGLSGQGGPLPLRLECAMMISTLPYAQP